MIKPIMNREFFLKRPSTAANADDLQIARDLADTLEAHRDTCAGMAANMIGQLKRIFEDTLAVSMNLKSIARNPNTAFVCVPSGAFMVGGTAW